MGVAVFHSDWLTDRRTDVTWLTVSIRSCFARAPKAGNSFLTVHHKTSYTTRSTKINQEHPVFENKVTGSAKRWFEPELNLCCHYIQIGQQTKHPCARTIIWTDAKSRVRKTWLSHTAGYPQNKLSWDAALYLGKCGREMYVIVSTESKIYSYLHSLSLL